MLKHINNDIHNYNESDENIFLCFEITKKFRRLLRISDKCEIKISNLKKFQIRSRRNTTAKILKNLYLNHRMYETK